MSSWITCNNKQSKQSKQNCQTANISATKRLSKDLKEVLRNPLPNITARPLENNLFIWHSNLRFRPFGKMNGSVIHLIFTFPKTYPSSPPKLQLCTPLPHANVEQLPGTRQQITLCLDLLTPPSTENNRQYAGWSSAYSVQSVLLQLQTFVLDESLLYRSLEICDCKQAAILAKNFCCKECGHCNQQPFPVFCERIEDHDTDTDFKMIRRPVIHRVRFLDNKRKKCVIVEPKSDPTNDSNDAKQISGLENAIDFFETESQNFCTKVSKFGQPNLRQCHTHLQALVSRMKRLQLSPKLKKYISSQFKDELNFIVADQTFKLIQGMSYGELKQFNYERGFGFISDVANSRNVFVHVSNLREKLQDKHLAPGSILRYFIFKDEHRHGKLRAENVQTWPLQQRLGELLNKLTNLDNAVDDICKIVVHDAAVVERLDQLEKLSKLKNRLAEMQAQHYNKQTQRRVRQQVVKLEHILNAQSKNMTKALPQPAQRPKQRQSQQPEQQQQSCTVMGVADGLKTHTGAFSFQGPDITVRIISYLSPGSRGLCSMASSTRYLYHMAEHGALWRCYFSRRYPTIQVRTGVVQDWKHAFELESNQARAEMICFHSKLDHEDAVLGLPVDFTINPKTRQVDYIKPIVEPLSLAAFKSGVRRSVWNEQFRAWLPLYITHDHFQRALPHLKRALLDLSPQYRHFEPAVVLDVLPRIMNTMVVMLADGGIANSDSAVHGYCQIHRLLIALMDHYPELQHEVNSRFNNFIRSADYRTKRRCPSLGHMLPLLSVCTVTTWRQFAKVYLEESFRRSVLWRCKKFPELEKFTEQGTGPDREFLNKSLKAMRVSTRICMFHAQFLELVARPSRVGGNMLSVADVAESYDRLLGIPSIRTRETVRGRTKEILAVASWPEFFRMLFLKAPSPSYMTDWMKRSVTESARAGYHVPGMDFGRVHKSGVSRLLLSGDSYSAPVGLSNVVLTQIWRYRDDLIYLDASILLYDFKGDFLQHIDYARTHSKCGAVEHSGDVVDEFRHQGVHTVNINLKQLPRNVHALFVVFSAFTTDLKDIVRPEVQFCDGNTCADLCRYELEDVAAKASSVNTAVIMCDVWRKSVGANWQVDAIGELCPGRAGSYSPIKKSIARYLGKL